MASYFYEQLMYHFTESTALWYDYDQGMCIICPLDRQVNNKREVYAPIKKNHNHRIFFQIRLEEQVIELWDSLGVNSNNEHFMQDLLHFIHDRSAEANPPNNPGWET